MILTIIFAVLLLLSILWLILDKIFDWETDIGAVLFTSLFLLVFAVNSIILFSSPNCTRANIKQFESVKNTISQQRENKLTELERVELTQAIIKNNEWLAKEQYWAKSKWLNWYYDIDILNLKPIK